MYVISKKERKNRLQQMKFLIREMTKEDYPQVAEIYGQGVTSGTATFQTSVPDYGEWDGSHLPFCRYVAEAEGKIIGWVALTQGLSRKPYSGVTELSIYVRDGYKRHGAGFALIERVKKNAERFGVWTLESRICRQNIGSIKLHEKCGFRMIGYREKIAKDKFGNWQDTVEMEIRL